MSLWRLEWLRLVRTSRWVALAAVFTVFGMLGPLTARYLSEIIKFAGAQDQGVTIKFPPPKPPDGMAEYMSNALQIGTIVIIVIAAGALAFDAIPEMGVFIRTRVPSVWRILVPRLVVPFAASAAAFTLGALTAWYETWTLLGALPVGAVLLGIGLGILFVAFVIAVVAAMAQWLRTVLSTVMASLVILIGLPIIGLVDVIGRWLPTRLGNALTDLTAGSSASDFWRPTVAAVVAIVALLWWAARGARRREA